MPKRRGFRPSKPKAKQPLGSVASLTKRLWRRHHLTYDQAIEVAKQALARHKVTHLLLQTRTKVLNNELDRVFRRFGDGTRCFEFRPRDPLVLAHL